MSGGSAEIDQLKRQIGAALNDIDRRAGKLTFDEFQAAYDSVLAEYTPKAREIGIESYLENLVASRACGMAFLYWDQPYSLVKPLHNRLALIPPHAADRHVILKWPLWCRYLIHTGHLIEARSVFSEFKAFAEGPDGRHWHWAPDWVQTLQQMLDATGIEPD